MSAYISVVVIAILSATIAINVYTWLQLRKTRATQRQTERLQALTRDLEANRSSVVAPRRGGDAK